MFITGPARFMLWLHSHVDPVSFYSFLLLNLNFICRCIYFALRIYERILPHVAVRLREANAERGSINIDSLVILLKRLYMPMKLDDWNVYYVQS